MKEYRIAQTRKIRAGQGVTAYPVEHAQHLVMTVDIKNPIIQAVNNTVGNHPDHPYSAKNMVRMCMRHEHIMNVINAYTRLLQLCQYAVAAAGVDQQPCSPCLNDKAGIVTPGGCCLTRAEHYYPTAIHLSAKVLKKAETSKGI